MDAIARKHEHDEAPERVVAPLSRDWAPPTPFGRGHVLVAVRWPVGGIRTHLLYNYPTIAKLGYAFTFVVPADDTFSAFKHSMDSALGPTDCLAVPVKGKHCGLWREVRRQLRTGQYDLMHSHGLTAAVQSAVANLGLGVPHVATLHDVFRPCHFEGISGTCKRGALGFLLKQIQRLVPVSGDVRLNLLEYVPSLRSHDSAIVTIPNGIQVDGEATAHGNAGDLRSRLGLFGNVRLIGFLGRFMEQKGFVPLIHALHKLAKNRSSGLPFHLVAVGSGDYRKEYETTARRLGLSSHLTILDFTPDVRPLLSQLDLLVIPSLWEASSLLGMEAMTLGVPVLGTDCIGLREVLRGTPARVVAAGNVEALAKGLGDALEFPWTAEAKAFAATARSRFDNTPSARKLAAVFKEVVGQRRVPC
jgi:glycosyltransferase involved in cell wall biosynthesis